jgi:hypothetical protein
MPRNLIPPDPWWPEAADLMARCDISLRQAAAELGIDLTVEEAETIKDRKLFQKALEAAKVAYYTEIGSSPRLSKDVVVGQIYRLANKLAQEGEAYKASDALLKLAKIKGWVGGEPDSLFDVFKDLTHNDIQEIKVKLHDRIAAEERGQPSPPEPGQKEREPIN